MPASTSTASSVATSSGGTTTISSTSGLRTAPTNKLAQSAPVAPHQIARPSPLPGMGAIPTEGGVSFRVWAPFASEIHVCGEFNNWSRDDDPLASEKNGYWSTFIPGAEAGQHYKFWIRNGNRAFFKNDPYVREVDQDTVNGVIVPDGFDWGDDASFERPPHNRLTIYELHVGTFSTGKSGGTFDGVRKRLSYFKRLGFNAIQLMPPTEFPTSLSWGYNVTNPFAVEQRYGGRNALKQLIKDAHAHGIAVLIDVVYNHFGPGDLDLWQFDGWSENHLGGIYFYNDWRAWTPWGHNRPDYGRPEVRQYIRDNTLMWFEEFHADGLRFDGVSFIRTVRGHNNDPTNEIPEGWSLLQWLSNEVNHRFPGRILIAEDLQQNAWLTKPTDHGGAGFHAQWDAGFVHPIREAAIVPDDTHRNMNAVRDALTLRYNHDAFQRVIYSESHDEVANGRARIPHEINPSDAGGYFAQKRSTLAATLVFTAPGIPMIFSGQEILEDEWFRDDVPVDWSKLAEFQGINRLYADLANLRLNQRGVTRGLTGQHIHVNHINYDGKVLSFHRWDHGGPGDDVIVLANFSFRSYSDYSFGLPRPGLWHVRFNSDWQGYSEEFGAMPAFDTEAHAEPLHNMPCRASIHLAPYSALILSQTP